MNRLFFRRRDAQGAAKRPLAISVPRWLYLGGGLLIVLITLGVLLRPLLGTRRDPTWARIRREGVLRVGMEASFPPFESVSDGRFVGLDVDLANALAERWGGKAQFVEVHFDGLYDALKVDKFDLIISALPYDRTLTRDMLYSQSYFNAGQVLLARADDANVRSLENLDHRRVAVELGAEAHQLLRELARDKGLTMEIVTRREPQEVVALLRAGDVDALVCDRVTAYQYLTQGQDLRLVGAPLSDEPYVIAMRRDAPLLLEQVNAALQAWRANDFMAELERRWLK
jgi:ABC-type amino acid transport substrate-binding protein